MIVIIFDINGRRISYEDVELSKVYDTHIILFLKNGMKVIINTEKTIIIEEIPDGN